MPRLATKVKARRFIPRDDAAAIYGVNPRTMVTLDQRQDDPAPWTGKGYECKQFGEWMRRQWRKEVGITEDGQQFDYAQERARLTRAQADCAELEAAELRGEMVRVSEVIEEWGRQTGAAKARLMTVPSKSAPRARTAESDEIAARIIRDEVVEALGELTDDGLPDRTRQRQARRTAALETAPAADGERMGRRKSSTKS